MVRRLLADLVSSSRAGRRARYQEPNCADYGGVGCLHTASGGLSWALGRWLHWRHGRVGMAFERGVLGLPAILSRFPTPAVVGFVASTCPASCTSRHGILGRFSSTSRKDGGFREDSSSSWDFGSCLGSRRVVCPQGVSGIRRRLLPRTFVFMARSTSDASDTVTVEEDDEYKVQEQILAHQKAAAKLSSLEEARTVVNGTSLGTLSVISKKFDGFPVGSMVTYAADKDGSIILSLSTLSPHTRDLYQNPKCSLLVPKDPTDRSDTIITIIGEALKVHEQDEAATRATYLKKHPGAFWVDFGDFGFVRIHPMKVRFVSGLVTGLAVVAEFTGQQFQDAKVDPISEFATPIAAHMNKDHSDQTAQIVEQSIGVHVESALINDVDRFGFTVLAKRKGKSVKLRIPFPRAAEDRKSVKELIIEMLKTKNSQDV